MLKRSPPIFEYREGRLAVNVDHTFLLVLLRLIVGGIATLRTHVRKAHKKVDVSSIFVDLGVIKLTTYEDAFIDRDTGWTAR